MVKKFSTPLAIYEVSDGVVYSVYVPDKVNLEQVKEHVRIILAELKEGAPHLTIADISQADRSNNKELRDHLSTPELSALSKATAVIADSIIARISANLYLRFSKNQSTAPTKFFANKEDALVWLQQFR